MRFLKLSVLAVVLFLGVACGQKSSEPKTTEEEVVYKDTDEVDKDVDKIDKEAVFPEGGIDGFRNLLASKVDADKIDEYEGAGRSRKWIFRKKPISKATISSVLTFTVEPDSTISDISAKGESQSFNEEIERAVKSIQTKWIPAEVKGEKVRSKYYVPVKITVE
mgnify:FL=1